MTLKIDAYESNKCDFVRNFIDCKFLVMKNLFDRETTGWVNLLVVDWWWWGGGLVEVHNHGMGSHVFIYKFSPTTEEFTVGTL